MISVTPHVTTRKSEHHRPKKSRYLVRPPAWTLEELLANVPEPHFSDEAVEEVVSEFPRSKEKFRPVRPPDWTLEELLANVPEPASGAPEPDASREVDTGLPVGKEVW